MRIIRGNIPKETALVIKKSMDKYTRYEEVFGSVTSIMKSPKYFYLSKNYQDVEMLAENLAKASLGNSWHYFCEKYLKDEKGYIIEERMFKRVIINDKVYIITGKPDVININENKVIDFKTTSTFVVQQELNMDSWEKQLNCYAWFLNTGFVNKIEYAMDEDLYRANLNKVQINKLEVQALLVNHSKKQEISRNNYPKSVEAINIEYLGDAFTENLVTTKMKLILKYKNSPLDNIPPCDDRFEHGGKVAIMKKGRKSAIRLLPNFEAAKQYLYSKIKKSWLDKCYLEKRPVFYDKCGLYCAYKNQCSFGRRLSPDGELLKDNS